MNALKVMEQNIKINTFNTEGLLPNGNWLRYMFARPSSECIILMKLMKIKSIWKEYIITVNGTNLKCKLTTEWIGREVIEGAQGNNYLEALIKLVNKYYSDILEIKEKSGTYYLCFLKQKFVLGWFAWRRGISSFSRRIYNCTFSKTICYFNWQ